MKVNEQLFTATAYIQCRICARMLDNDEVLDHIFDTHKVNFTEIIKERFVMVRVELNKKAIEDESNQIE